MNNKISRSSNKSFGIVFFIVFFGRIVSPIVLGLIYFFVVTPTGVIMRIFGKDLLGLKQSNKNSYWIKRKKNNSSMKNQF